MENFVSLGKKEGKYGIPSHRHRNVQWNISWKQKNGNDEKEEEDNHLRGKSVTGDLPEFRSSDEKRFMENERVRQRRKKSESFDGGGKLAARPFD